MMNVLAHAFLIDCCDLVVDISPKRLNLDLRW